ncbi:conjugal transfer protein [Streptomyces huiliensis]|uniref:conjugal transfer protein n=1 Tax=Streptomyces huiliensis TaxID=2876027 RepID=UPI001CC187AF|nr:conjugal transfer protein [Streptomyces huiliensis]
MLAIGVAGGLGTFSNISGTYGTGTALGAVAAGEGATAVLALVLLGLTMLGQSSPLVVRAGLWLLPAAASVMAAMAAEDPGRTVIYAVTPMGMCVAAEGMAFLARRIVVHTDGRDAEAEARAAAVVQALAYHRARAANHPDEKVRKESELTSWKLARKIGTGDASLGARLLDVQRERLMDGADGALLAMFTVTDERQTGQPDGTPPALGPHSSARPALPPARTPVDHLEQEAAEKPSAQATPCADGVRKTDPHTARTAPRVAPEKAAWEDQFEEARRERLRQDARRTYLESAQAGRTLSARALGEAYGMSESWGRKQILAVRDRTEEPHRPHLRAVDGHPAAG